MKHLVIHDNISIHALREEGDPQDYVGYKLAEFISIHALREEGDMMFRDHDKDREPISIHALREEGDPSPGSSSTSLPSNFYPRPPRGGRLFTIPNVHGDELFLSTPSARRATGGGRLSDLPAGISIHALREEGDLNLILLAITPGYFYPRPPRGGRPAYAAQYGDGAVYFYPRPPRGGRRG